MHKFSAAKMVAWTGHLHEMHETLKRIKKKHNRNLGIRFLKLTAKLISENLASLGCKVSASAAMRLSDQVNEQWTDHKLKTRTDELHETTRDELETHLFLWVPAEKASYYNQIEPLFGSEVSEKFPSALLDIEEAGKCLATNRSTACVFHLMRVMEAGLKGLAKEIKIPYAPSWESYLKQIGSKLSLPWKKRTVKQRNEHLFLVDAQAHLSSVKVAWRNPTMHIVRHYSEEQAEEIYNSIRAFMRHLATKLKA